MTLILLYILSAFVFAQLVQTFGPSRPIFAPARVRSGRVALVWGAT